MGELLKRILCIREDIYKLRELSNANAYNYCELAIAISDTMEDISIMSSEKKCIENYIKDFKYNKSLLYSLPIGIVVFSSYLLYLVITNSNPLTFGSAITTILVPFACCMTAAVGVAALCVRSKKFNNFLIRKYSTFKNRDDQLNNLNIKINELENNLITITNKKEEIMNTIVNNEEIIESKTEELDKLEKEYFNNIKNNPVTKGTTYILSSAGKKRTLTRGCDYR